jgi:hypothetical protein
MAMNKGDWFPVSFSSILFGIDFVGTMLDVAISLEVEVAGMTVTTFVWITVTTMDVCVGTVVRVAEGILEGVNVGEADGEGVITANGTTYRRRDITGIRTLINKNTVKTFTELMINQPHGSIP